MHIVEVCGRVRVYWLGVVVVARCVTSYLPVNVPAYHSFMCVMCGINCEGLCVHPVFRFALVVFAFLFRDLVHVFCTRLILRWSSELNTCLTVAIVLKCLSKKVARIDYVPLLRCCSSCFATLVQPGCFKRLLFCLQRAYFTFHGALAMSALFA